MMAIPLTDQEHDELPTLDWLQAHDHTHLIEAALERVASGRSGFADARLLAFAIGLAFGRRRSAMA